MLELHSKEKHDLDRQAPLWALILLQAAQNQDRALLMGCLSSGILEREEEGEIQDICDAPCSQSKDSVQKADHS